VAVEVALAQQRPVARVRAQAVVVRVHLDAAHLRAQVGGLAQELDGAVGQAARPLRLLGGHHAGHEGVRPRRPPQEIRVVGLLRQRHLQLLDRLRLIAQVRLHDRVEVQGRPAPLVQLPERLHVCAGGLRLPQPRVRPGAVTVGPGALRRLLHHLRQVRDGVALFAEQQPDLAALEARFQVARPFRQHRAGLLEPAPKTLPAGHGLGGARQADVLLNPAGRQPPLVTALVAVVSGDVVRVDRLLTPHRAVKGVSVRPLERL
jgi:hypothetical protein